MELRIGLGVDGHEFEEGKRLFLGGVEIPSGFGLKGHSDGDALLHALTDAILGAIGEGDIGEHFRDTDPRWKDAPSEIFLRRALQLMREKGFRILNVDCVVIADRPKLSPHKEAIRKKLSELLEVEKERISLKGKRREGISQTEGLSCICSVLLVKD
ncbi:MAG: 2-C-methyl-D-erythritol 2,4-cyclodiphosphate synthase [Aquificae bacterium]|nr:2-C-methyl-D-erythritol 2,4-cyclodiphosphate synthase [Aquificota bacterium]